jgi:RNA polymerase sigma-70 factor, ECF subfamily
MTLAVLGRESGITQRYLDPADDGATTLDDAEFAALVGRYRRELRGHCYRMLKSTDRADDAVQETLLHAWRARESFAGRAKLRSWLYRIATNVCLDVIDRERRHAGPHQGSGWIAPAVGGVEGSPDAAAPRHAQPDSLLTAKESIERACLTMFALLTPRQRAVLVLRDVLGWSASDTATLLDTTVAAANSALQRARARLESARSASDEIRPSGTVMRSDGRGLLARYVEALGCPDPKAAVELVRADVAIAA